MNHPNYAIWFTAPRSVELRPAAAPPPGPDQVQVQTRYSAISHGTEMLVYRGEVDPALELDLPTLAGGYGFPISFGYACVGHITALGSAVRERAVGDLVFCLHPHQQYLTVAAALTVLLPATLDPAYAALAANLETALNIVHDAHPRLGEDVVVFGQGVVGLLVGLLLRRAGVGHLAVVEPSALRRQLALALGADLALEPTPDLAAQLYAARGRAPDLAIEVSGAPRALQQAIDSVALEGTVIAASWYGRKTVHLDLGGHFHRGRVNLRSSQVGRLNPASAPRWDYARRWQTVASLLPQLPLDRLISRRIPFIHAADAYRLIDSDPHAVVQLLLEY